MNARPSIRVVAFAVCLFICGKTVFAQAMDEKLVAPTGEIEAKADAIHVDRPVLTPSVLAPGAITKASERQSADRPFGTGRNLHDLSFFSRLIMAEGAKDVTPDSIEGAWQEKRALIVGSIRALDAKKRGQIISALDSLLNTMTAYAFDRDHIRQAFMDDQETIADYERKGGLYARSVREAEDKLMERMEGLGLERDGLALANDLWTTGGQPLLQAAINVGAEFRKELEFAVNPPTSLAFPQNNAAR
jgi:hypothetical protein